MPMGVGVTVATHGAVEIISAQLKNDLPGLMGFGVTSLKNMRKFYEAWATIEDKSATAVADLQNTEKAPWQIQRAISLNAVFSIRRVSYPSVSESVGRRFSRC